MGQKSSKPKGGPWPPYAPPPFPTGAYGYQPFIPPGYGPPPGFPQPMQQPFIPPMPGQPPQSNIAWLPQDVQQQQQKRKGTKKGRAQSEQFAGGFRGEAPFPPQMPQPVIPDNAPVIPNHAPVIPRSSRRYRRRPAPLNADIDRQNTPFGRPPSDSEGTSSDEDEDDEHPNRRRRRTRRRRARSVDYPPITGRIDDVLQPPSPTPHSAYGPGERPFFNHRKNPLPAPPRDLYEMTPYKSLLSLPQTTALLTATYNVPNTGAIVPPPVAPGLVPQPSTKKKKGGLLRAFSSRRKKEEPVQPVAGPSAPQVQFVPVFVPADQRPGQTQAHQVDSSAASQRRASVHEPQRQDLSAFTSGGQPVGINGSASNAESTLPLLFNQQDTKYAPFMNHSPHRVLYRGEAYPTATHLHEAIKYIDQHPDIAARIRSCEDVMDVYPLSAEFTPYQRADWGAVFLEQMESVLMLKFSQHPNLRTLLLDTDKRPLIYADVLDSFWGEGPDGTGQNELGKVLTKVRARLREEMRVPG
ncbi:DUF1768-domain-containing protein [Coprinopsis marcescibilis]|uniref:DUF1768-domain-containing protein n=1 Tax=Coprinopsis marcescibilis TaxID=230819 RepID=A0A5C3L8Y3_COPMA|nr:DUF1768-domain-containing protein [Coprinopsis marcescibilis]